jgi:hypothetical protein
MGGKRGQLSRSVVNPDGTEMVALSMSLWYTSGRFSCHIRRPARVRSVSNVALKRVKNALISQAVVHRIPLVHLPLLRQCLALRVLRLLPVRALEALAQVLLLLLL